MSVIYRCPVCKQKIIKEKEEPCVFCECGNVASIEVQSIISQSSLADKIRKDYIFYTSSNEEAEADEERHIAVTKLSVVYKVKARETGKVRVLKVSLGEGDTERERTADSVKMEYAFLHIVSNKVCVPRVFNTYKEEKKQFAFVMSYIDGENLDYKEEKGHYLYKDLAEPKDFIDLSKAECEQVLSKLMGIAVQVFEKLVYLKQPVCINDEYKNNGVVHRDIKPANIMFGKMDDDQEEQYYLIDYNLAKILVKKDATGIYIREGATVLGGTKYYNEPFIFGEREELRKERKSLCQCSEISTHAFDVLGLCRTLFILLLAKEKNVGYFLNSVEEDFDKIYDYRQQEFNKYNQIKAKVKKLFKDKPEYLELLNVIMEGMHQDPAQRPTAERALYRIANKVVCVGQQQGCEGEIKAAKTHNTDSFVCTNKSAQNNYYYPYHFSDHLHSNEQRKIEGVCCGEGNFLLHPIVNNGYIYAIKKVGTGYSLAGWNLESLEEIAGNPFSILPTRAPVVVETKIFVPFEQAFYVYGVENKGLTLERKVELNGYKIRSQPINVDGILYFIAHKDNTNFVLKLNGNNIVVVHRDITCLTGLAVNSANKLCYVYKSNDDIFLRVGERDIKLSLGSRDAFKTKPLMPSMAVISHNKLTYVLSKVYGKLLYSIVFCCDNNGNENTDLSAFNGIEMYPLPVFTDRYMYANDSDGLKRYNIDGQSKPKLIRPYAERHQLVATSTDCYGYVEKDGYSKTVIFYKDEIIWFKSNCIFLKRFKVE